MRHGDDSCGGVATSVTDRHLQPFSRFRDLHALFGQSKPGIGHQAQKCWLAGNHECRAPSDAREGGVASSPMRSVLQAFLASLLQPYESETKHSHLVIRILEQHEDLTAPLRWCLQSRVTITSLVKKLFYHLLTSATSSPGCKLRRRSTPVLLIFKSNQRTGVLGCSAKNTNLSNGPLDYQQHRTIYFWKICLPYNSTSLVANGSESL